MVWQQSVNLVTEIYIITKDLPKEELYGLSSQMRRAAVSIPSNIAEGQKRKSIGEYIQFLYIANASAAELETQLVITSRIYPHIELSNTQSKLLEVQKMLAGLIKNLKPKT